MSPLEIDELTYPNERLARWAEQQQAILVDPQNDMQAKVARTRVYLHGFEGTILGDGHYNEAGHAIFARLVGQELCGALMKAD